MDLVRPSGDPKGGAKVKRSVKKERHKNMHSPNRVRDERLGQEVTQDANAHLK